MQATFLLMQLHSVITDYLECLMPKQMTNKEVILQSLADPQGKVRVVFATMALGMGVDFHGLTRIIHYGAPRSLEDYFQESGRAGCGGEPSMSTMYWSPSDVPLKKDFSVH